jgi:hypothetical protein
MLRSVVEFNDVASKVHWKVEQLERLEQTGDTEYVATAIDASGCGRWRSITRGEWTIGVLTSATGSR